ncbi:uncharacterized protein PFL1_02392 [Pseudozyma flocculosa PF-1]|uniref:uncharacterized protein n=1 Tax=Pseudozyma flocculosa PF-1 TaxID=1277687 RepID=UPI0004560F0B|nr:uncharacterized protein PFL1_02392 [Pseudozyma flocculosa PF-1]EPQ30276.1 hypothetical protein PFL1_02392 [Pseudozyma flocculosa PF-1]
MKLSILALLPIALASVVYSKPAPVTLGQVFHPPKDTASASWKINDQVGTMTVKLALGYIQICLGVSSWSFVDENQQTELRLDRYNTPPPSHYALSSVDVCKDCMGKITDGAISKSVCYSTLEGDADKRMFQTVLDALSLASDIGAFVKAYVDGQFRFYPIGSFH